MYRASDIIKQCFQGLTGCLKLGSTPFPPGLVRCVVEEQKGAWSGQSVPFRRPAARSAIFRFARSDSRFAMSVVAARPRSRAEVEDDRLHSPRAGSPAQLNVMTPSRASSRRIGVTAIFVN